MGGGKRLDQLLRNEWELYDVKKMMRLKAVVVTGLFAFLWAVIFFMVFTFHFEIADAVGDVLSAAIIATVIIVLVGAVVAVRIVQVDRDKAGWYFSTLQHPALNRDDVLAMARVFLSQHGYTLFREDGHQTLRLHITYFDIFGANFKMRVWFTGAVSPPIVEIGFGPETMLNKAELLRLRTDMSAEFVKRYGYGGQGQRA